MELGPKKCLPGDTNIIYSVLRHFVFVNNLIEEISNELYPVFANVVECDNCSFFKHLHLSNEKGGKM